MSSNDSRNFGLAVVALVGFAAMLVWVMISPSSQGAEPAASVADEAPPPAPEPAAEPPKPVASAAPQPEAPPSAAPQHTADVDLFAGPAPDFITDAHARVLDKKWLDVTMQKRLYEFGQEHKNDARPQLLLAWDSMNREWWGIAVRMYRIAYRADNRVKHDPTMLRDLLFIASRFDRTEFREATEVIREAYGEEALPRIDDAIRSLRDNGHMEGSERLSRLRAAIAGQ